MVVFPPAAAHTLHARIAPADVLVDERRTLYRLAADLFVPGIELSDNLADHPIARFEIGRALAGHGDLDITLMCEAESLAVRDVGVPLAAGSQAARVLEAPLRIIGPSGAALQPLTEADGERFEAASRIVAEGVRLFRSLAPEVAEDLLAHVSMLAVLKRETSGGVVSASSRYVPGIVLIDEPSLPIEVAEALVHEGAHEKFFDLAITREFLDAHAEDVELFENSWSHARWPLEQTFAAWHAYSCLAQFSAVCDGVELGPLSLLPKAGERAREIGAWLLAREQDLLPTARWLLRAVVGAPAATESYVDVHAPLIEVHENDLFRVLPGVRYRHAQSRRVVAGRATQPPEVFWLDGDAGWTLGQCCHDGAPKSFARLLIAANKAWMGDPDVVTLRLTAALTSLMRSSLVG